MRRHLPLAKQFIKFGLVGLSNTAISMSLYYALVYLGVNYLVANLIGFMISVLNSYYWNNRYVFNKTEEGHLKPILKTYMAYGSTLLLSTFLLYLMVQQLGISQWIAPLLNLAITIPINFLINKLWAFR